MPSHKVIDHPPSPAALIQSLRDIGYSIETAVADLIDNSLFATSSEIDVRFSWNAGQPWLAIADDGYGMCEDDLIAAMRFGSKSPLEKRSPADLGRFGLGMKTASFSQCRHLTVLSKIAGAQSCCEWDLDTIAANTDHEWSLGVLGPGEVARRPVLSLLASKYLDKRESGTVVLWEKIDRIDRDISVERQEAVFNKLLADVRTHLELVFHRYLSPDRGYRGTRILMNEDPLAAFDPFNFKCATTVELPEEQFLCEGERVSVQPYVLPHHNKVSQEEYKKFAGISGYRDSQGFYVYRNKRLIIRGTWFRLIPKDELTKLLRVRIDIPNTLDHLWRIDVKKATAFPPESIATELRRIIAKIEISGKKVYRQRGAKIGDSAVVPAWQRRASGGTVHYEINRDHPLLESILSSLPDQQANTLDELMSLIERSFPSDAFFHDFASAPEQIERPVYDEKSLIPLLDIIVTAWGGYSGLNGENIRDLLGTEPFCHSRELTTKILASKGARLD